MAVPTKQYGLILSQKKGASKTAILQKPSVFGDDSDDETSVGESLQREAVKKKMMKQTRLEMQKALEEDSTVYDYDAVYDDIQNQRLESNKAILRGTDKKPKYIHQLMKAVEDRKKEQERREERKIQKEREAEGEKFADKEAYVTSAYKQKLQEQKEEQERENREAVMEAALDVKKQKDLSGFYRHLLNQTVGEEAIPDRSANKTQTSKVSKDAERTSPVPSSTSHDNIPSSCSDSEEGHEQKSGFSKPAAGSTHSKRQYRQRSPSSGSGEEKERERERDRHKKSHRDRGRDRDRDRDRNRGRDDRYDRGRRDDRDRRKDRDRDRGREDDRSRGKGETEREDRHGKRERSPKERERDKNGDREKRRNSDEDKRKDKDLEEEKERRKAPGKEMAVKSEEKDPENKESVGEPKMGKERQEGTEKEESEEKANKFAKRSTDQTVSSARDRYMARQMARSACKTYIEKEED
ncbi:nuclear speckle splicing regulatory protein 1 [Micropterus salmoides]|uniref:nuclear speckle splicing regulatory protein 1 n=1 Tax=Micropterus salmoides TaxID=27706 RepID=UPI0018EB4A15|nr:nuclear speckle splicing regulatory protein 1 [Micropterus salmoides]XP_045897065.1 nuclear speckle splicing regulatory protein 1 [Micropterus dolomieu]